MRNLLQVVHVIAVAAWLGGNLVLAYVGAQTRGADRATRRWWAQVQGSMARTYYNVAGIVVLLSGVGLVLSSDFFSFSDRFVSIGFLAVIIGALLGVFVFGPGSRDLVAAIEDGDETREAHVNNRLAMTGMIDSLVLVVAIVSMVAHWGR